MLFAAVLAAGALLLFASAVHAQPVQFERMRNYQAMITILNGSHDETIAAFDSALAELRHVRGLLLDLREANSLSPELSLDLARRFLPMPMKEFHVRPDSAIVLNPRGEWQYDKPLVILVDSASGAAHDLFIRALAQRFYTRNVGTDGAPFKPEIVVHSAPEDSSDVIQQRGRKTLDKLVTRFRNQRQNRMDWMFKD